MDYGEAGSGFERPFEAENKDRVRRGLTEHFFRRVLGSQ